MRFSLAIGVALVALVKLEALAQALPSFPGTAPQANAPVPVIVEDDEGLARNRLRNEMIRLLKAQDYRGLDALAEQLQRSGRTFSRGYGEITFFFSELADLPKQATNEEWEAHLQLLRDWSERDSDSVSPRIAMARALVGYACKARGTDCNVTDEGSRLMGERLTEARRVLVAAESLPHNCPVFYSTQLKIANLEATSRESHDKLFSEAVNAFPNHFHFYVLRALYLRGEPGEWEAFATATADQIGGEDGDVLYAQIVWAMHEARIYGNILNEAAVDWSRTQRGFEALCRKYPNSISVPSEYCSVSGFAPKGARKLMRSLFSRLGNRVDLSVWITTEIFLRDYKWAFSSQ